MLEPSVETPAKLLIGLMMMIIDYGMMINWRRGRRRRRRTLFCGLLQLSLITNETLT